MPEYAPSKDAFMMSAEQTYGERQTHEWAEEYALLSEERILREPVVKNCKMAEYMLKIIRKDNRLHGGPGDGSSRLNQTIHTYRPHKTSHEWSRCR